MAQTVPQRSEIPAQHTWDTAAVYPSHATWEAELARVDAQLPELAVFQGQLGSSPQRLAEWLDTDERLMNTVARLYFYANMFHNVDTNDHVVEVRLSIRDGVVTSVIEDDGHPYDPRESPEPDLSMPVEQRGPGGLGIFLVRQMMDSIDYARRDGKNVLTVTASRREGDE